MLNFRLVTRYIGDMGYAFTTVLNYKQALIDS